MAWTSMHFAVGMAGGAVIGGLACMIAGRGWRWLTAGMTAAGAWAVLPDVPRFFREDFPGLPLASVLGSKALERELHQIGDLFFLHARLDAQPRELALHGFVLIILLYFAGWAAALVGHPSRRLRHHVSGSPLGSHGSRRSGHRSRRRHHRRSRRTAAAPAAAQWAPPRLTDADAPAPLPPLAAAGADPGGGAIAETLGPDDPDAPAIAGRIRSSHLWQTSENAAPPRAATPTGSTEPRPFAPT